MAKTHIPLEDLFQGEESSEVIAALDESIGRAIVDECRLIVEGRAEPQETRRSRQEFTVELDPGSDPPPHAESVLAELQRNYEEALGPNFRGTVRLNFKGKGRNVTYRSLQRKAYIEGPEDDEDEPYLLEGEGEEEDEEEERHPYRRPSHRSNYYRPTHTRSPRLDLSREDDDDLYLDESSPPGTISPGRVRGLNTAQGEYIFLPHFEAVVNVGERRNDRVLKALMDQQGIQAEITKTLLENQRELNEQMLGMVGTKAMRAQREADKPADNKMANWLGSMLVKGVMDKVKQGGPGGPGTGHQNRPRQDQPATAPPSEEYEPYDSPTFTVPSAHSSEFDESDDGWDEDEFQPPAVRSPGHRNRDYETPEGPMSGDEIMDAIRDLRESDPDAFNKTIKERGDELVPAVMEAMSE